MIGASGLSGDTLIACSFPVVPLPTWQLPVQALCGSAKRPGRLFSVGLTRAVSLPEQDSLNRDHAFSGGRRQFSSSYCSLNEDRGEEEGGSDSSGRYDSTSSPEETSSQLKENPGARGAARSHNSFLPNSEMDDEEDDDSDGGNLHKYREDSAFVLQGNSNWPLSTRMVAERYQLSQEHGDTDWMSEGTVLGPDGDQGWSQPNQQYSYQSDRPPEDSGGLTGRGSFCIHGQHRRSPESDPRSDSSCNSSDGILVNFCTIYNRSNNPATPHDLISPALRPSESSEGSVFLSLQPVSPARQEDTSPSTPCWSPPGLDSNCNLYSSEALPQGLSSLELSDLNACLQNQVSLAIGTNQKYYKLVTCDLSSQSPSPAWSSSTSCPEGQVKGSPCITAENHFFDQNKAGRAKDLKREDQPKEKRISSECSGIHDHQTDAASTLKAPCKQKHTESLPNVSGTHFSLCTGQESPESSTSFAATQVVFVDRERRDAGAEGANLLENEAKSNSKPQRPTSLPIQPFVLVPAGPPEAPQVGCLLEQYMNQKSQRVSTSQPGSKFKGKRSRCFSSLQLSPMGSHYPVFLEPPSSSDSCSSGMPSPEWCGRRHTWSQSSRFPARLSPCTSKRSVETSHARGKPVQAPEDTSPHSGVHVTLTPPPNRPTLVKIPTYQDLNNLTPKPNYTGAFRGAHTHTCYPSLFSQTPPTLPISAPSHHLKPEQRPLLPPRAAPAADSGFFHGSFTAALSSMAPLPSLSSLLSFAASGGTSQPSESVALSDQLPADSCPSPDASYESLSISHLQRRGLLRSVSRAVDLIMTHFGSSRDPDEKMRLGNSSCSPTIAGLVLEHLCPSIQNILEDGLRDHKLDLIIGQRRNHPWSVVEVSTRTGPSTKVLHRLVCKIRMCPQLSTHCMRLRAFLMGLLK
eukprot:XP_011603282.1 PREDICTED: iporin-like [Takifugu rubripes]